MKISMNFVFRICKKYESIRYFCATNKNSSKFYFTKKKKNIAAL